MAGGQGMSILIAGAVAKIVPAGLGLERLTVLVQRF